MLSNELYEAAADKTIILIKLSVYSVSSMLNLEFNMNAKEQIHFDRLYTRRFRTLKLRGMSAVTINKWSANLIINLACNIRQ